MIESKQYEWLPIEIKPNDQSLVGEVVKSQSKMFGMHIVGEVSYIGKEIIIIFSQTESEMSETSRRISSFDWLIRREVKKEVWSLHGDLCSPSSIKKKERKVWAFGWYKTRDGWRLSFATYHSRDHFISNTQACSDFIWPAKLDADGFFEEPDDEE